MGAWSHNVLANAQGELAFVKVAQKTCKPPADTIVNSNLIYFSFADTKSCFFIY
jgi:hypothetical protein